MNIIKNIGIKNNSIFFSWLISYIIILLIPVVIINIGYFETVKAIEFEINRAHISSLKQLQQTIDDKLGDMQRLSIEVALNDNNKYLLNVTGEMMPEHRYTMIKLLNDLHVYKIANKFIDDIFIYYRTGNIIISDQGKSDADEYYNLYYLNSGMTYDEWLGKLKQLHRKDFISWGGRPNAKEQVKSIAFIQTLPIYENKLAGASVVMVIDENTLRKAIKEMKWLSEGALLIIDKSNNLLASSNPVSLPDSLNYSRLKESNDIFSDKINGEDVVVSYISSEVNSWKYIFLIPKSVFLKKASFVRNILFACILVCLVLGVFFAYILTRKNYNPVRKLVNIFERKTGKADRKYIGYDYFEKSILQLINEEDRVSKLLGQQNQVIMNNFIGKLLKGKIRDKALILQACESHNINFYSDDFAIMLFYIESLGDIWKEKDTGSHEDTLKTIYFIITNVVQELAGNKNSAYMAEVDDMIVCLVNFKDTTADHQLEMLEIAEKSKDFIREKFEIYFTVSISNTFNSIDGIPEAYQQVMDAIEYRIIMGGEGIICFNNISKSRFDNSNYRYTIDEERQFINCLKVNDYKNARNILNRIFEVFFEDEHASVQLIKCRMFGLVNTMINVLCDINTLNEKYFIKDNNFVERLLNCKTIRDLQHGMNGILEEMDKKFSVSTKDRDATYKDSIMNFISQNYQDVNFGVYAIADKLNISEAQLSRIFKKQAGIGLLDYIHKVRIEKAKQLLTDSNITIKDVASKTGYSDSISFIRVFKKYEGITPGKYKELQ